MTRTQTHKKPRSGLFALASGVAAGGVAGVIIGLADTAWAASRHGLYERGEELPNLFPLHTTALDVTLFLGVGLLYGLVCAAAPVALGPLALIDRLRRFAISRGTEGAARSARAWATVLGVGAAAGGAFLLSRHFSTAYHHKGLAAVALTGSLFLLADFAWVLRATAAHYLGRLTEALARRSRAWAVVVGPLPLLVATVISLGAAGVALAVVITPMRHALPLLPVTLVLLGLGLVWFVEELLLRWMGRRFAVPLTLLFALLSVALLAVSYVTFDDGREDRITADAIRRYSALAVLTLRPLEQWSDQDHDGYPGHFGGGDCDDDKPNIHPAAVDIPDNDIDENCSGGDLKSAEIPAVLRRRGDKTPLSTHPRRRYNIVLIVIDALRADRVGWAGYKRSLTPYLDRLSKRSLVFDNAYSPSVRTGLTLPALLTGRYPSELHRTNGYFLRVAKGNPSVAEALRRSGYATLASVCHPYLRDHSGLERGFDHWKVFAKATKGEMNKTVSSPQVVDSAIALLEQHRRSRGASGTASPAPFFLFVYTMDPHTHYLRHPELADYGRDLVDRYDAEIRFTDQHLGRFFDFLEKRGLLKNTIVAVTADHGEAFGENGVSFHGLWLYEHQLRVPWLLYVPDLGARHFKPRVSLMDLAPTLFDLTGVRPPARIQGQSLRPWLAPEAPPLPPRVIYSEVLRSVGNDLKRSVILGRWKLIHQPHGDRYRLYDLAQDPAELRNLLASNPRRARAMKQLYEAYVATQLKLVPGTP